MCTLCCREYTWQWIKIWISICFGVFDIIVDIAYYAALPQASKQSGPGTAWLVIWIISLLLFIGFIATRIVCIKRVLHRPDDFDHSVPTEKNLRLDTTVLIFDVVFLIFEDIPQFILLLIIQANGWTTSAVFAMISIFLSITLILFTGIYIFCCCGSRSTLVRMRTCVVFCDFCGCGWSEKYDAARIRLESTKASGKVAVEMMDAAGINVPQGVREVVAHITRDEGNVTLEQPRTPPPQQAVQVQVVQQQQPMPPQTVQYTVQPQATVQYTTYPPPQPQVVYVQQYPPQPQQPQPNPYY